MDFTKEVTSIEKYDLRGKYEWEEAIVQCAVLDDRLTVCSWRRRSMKTWDTAECYNPRTMLAILEVPCTQSEGTVADAT